MKISTKNKTIAIVGGVVFLVLIGFMFKELGGLANLSIGIGLILGVFDIIWCF